MVDLSSSTYEDVLQETVNHPSTPEASLVSLATNCQNAQIRGNALNRVLHAETPADVLAHLAVSQYEDVTLPVASHPNSPLETRLRLARESPHSSVRQSALAQILQSPTPELLATLASSRYEDILLEVVRHPQTPGSCYPQLTHGLGTALQNRFNRQGARTEKVWVDDTEYDAYGGYYSSSGHYEDQEVTVTVPDYERINQLLASLPTELRAALREQSGNLKTDPKVLWNVG
jgi:hypothetical protein